MTKRTLVVLAALILILAPLALNPSFRATWFPFMPEPVITLERALSIQRGMTEAEVRAILGGPAGDYAGNAVVTYSRGGVGADETMYYEGTNWWGIQGMIQVQFNQEGRVEDWGYYYANSEQRIGFWGELRAMLPFGAKRNHHGWVAAHW